MLIIKQAGRRSARRLRRVVDVRPGETKALAWAWLYVFALFLAYYVMRPIRDELGVAGGVRNLPWLFTGTLLAMLVVNPLFAWSVRRWTRERFVAIAYRFFMLHLLVFAALLWSANPALQVWVGRAFFIWVSVFNLFVVSVFWSVVVDTFTAAQGKRLFGVVSAGATLGGAAGAAITSGLVEGLGQHGLLLVPVVLLEVALFAARRLSRLSGRTVASGQPRRPLTNASLDGGVLAGISHTVRSPYLLAIAAFVALPTSLATLLYFLQATVAATHFTNPAERTAFFASLDFWVNLCTFVLQMFVTGRLMRWLGVAALLCVLPLASMFGFAAIASFPTLAVFVVVQVARRVSDFALTRPAREVLFTSVSPEDRYKAKNFIDTVVYRSGDQIGSWAHAGLMSLGLGMPGVAIVAAPFAALWLALAYWLGRRTERPGQPAPAAHALALVRRESASSVGRSRRDRGAG
ncbi:MFS transporter [Paraburkholderia sp. SIMBA_049]